MPAWLRSLVLWLRSAAALVRARWCPTGAIEVDAAPAPRKGLPPRLYAERMRRGACYVDGSSRRGRGGAGVYYAPGHPLNRAIRVPHGDNNVCELCAIYAAVAAHPRGEPLRIFSDSALALKALDAASGGRGAGRLSATGVALARATVALARLRLSETVVASVAAHADAEGNQVADALAARGAEDGALAELPRSGFLATLWLELGYLRRQLSSA